MERVCHAPTLHRMTESVPLKRSLSLLLLTFYGLGTILGAARDGSEVNRRVVLTAGDGG